MWQGDQFRTSFSLIKNFYNFGLQLRFNIFQQSRTQHTIKINGINVQTNYSEICSILTFQETVWEYLLHHILRMIFHGKSFSCYILVTDQVSLPGCLYFLRYCTMCVLQIFVFQVATSLILKRTLSFLYFSHLHDQKFRTKILISWERKNLLR